MARGGTRGSVTPEAAAAAAPPRPASAAADDPADAGRRAGERTATSAGTDAGSRGRRRRVGRLVVGASARAARRSGSVSSAEARAARSRSRRATGRQSHATAPRWMATATTPTPPAPRRRPARQPPGPGASRPAHAKTRARNTKIPRTSSGLSAVPEGLDGPLDDRPGVNLMTSSATATDRRLADRQHVRHDVAGGQAGEAGDQPRQRPRAAGGAHTLRLSLRHDHHCDT